MALVVSGQLSHCQMQPHQVHAALRHHLPGLVVSSPDFAVNRNTCRIEFFCNTSSTLDFTVTLTAKQTPAPAAVAVLGKHSPRLRWTGADCAQVGAGIVRGCYGLVTGAGGCHGAPFMRLRKTVRASWPCLRAVSM